MVHGLEIALNSKVRDLLYLRKLNDLDYFSLRLSGEIVSLLNRGYSVKAACQQAISKLPTQFFRVNKLRRIEFAGELYPRLRGLRSGTTLPITYLTSNALQNANLWAPFERPAMKRAFALISSPTSW